ncbi:hypothetical protein CAEBREN_21211 [Caenorhabditis brenneri]|uniref:Uncharacterized protein n=1 Tax=Caenorhabditis brenneri TaxID=135651 RepID=G0NTL1_CAEBE|nr:hypothetical protein CAEBREN_21211 [Caenorhabditis brenneri]
MYSYENSTIEEYRRFDFFTIVGVFSLISQIITLFSIQFLLLTVFPFFIIVSRSNRENDKKTSIYPLINHLYYAVCFSYVLYPLNLVFHFFRKASPIFYNANTLVFYVSVTMTNAHNLILVLSAIQKFCLYFFQNFESYLNLSKKAVHRILFCIHLIVQVKQLVYWNDSRENNYSIDIIIDLMTAAISFYIFTTYGEVETVENKMEAFYRLRELDNNSTPVLIQVSYLLSSQKNIDKVKELLSVKKIIKSLFPRWFKASAVRPITYIDLMETTVNS